MNVEKLVENFYAVDAFVKNFMQQNTFYPFDIINQIKNLL